MVLASPSQNGRWSELGMEGADSTCSRDCHLRNVLVAAEQSSGGRWPVGNRWAACSDSRTTSWRSSGHSN